MSQHERATRTVLYAGRCLDAWNAELERGEVKPGEMFGVLRRALDRAVERIDEAGAEIVANPGAKGQVAADRLAQYVSAIAQVATVGLGLLQHTPGILELAEESPMHAIGGRGGTDA